MRRHRKIRWQEWSLLGERITTTTTTEETEKTEETKETTGCRRFHTYRGRTTFRVQCFGFGPRRRSLQTVAWGMAWVTARMTARAVVNVGARSGRFQCSYASHRTSTATRWTPWIKATEWERIDGREGVVSVVVQRKRWTHMGRTERRTDGGWCVCGPASALFSTLGRR